MKLVLTEHNVISAISADAPMVRTRMTPFLVRQFYPWADELVAVSQGAAPGLSRTRRPKAKIHVIYNPIIGPEFWRPCGRTTQRFQNRI